MMFSLIHCLPFTLTVFLSPSLRLFHPPLVIIRNIIFSVLRWIPCPVSALHPLLTIHHPPPPLQHNDEMLAHLGQLSNNSALQLASPIDWPTDLKRWQAVVLWTNILLTNFTTMTTLSGTVSVYAVVALNPSRILESIFIPTTDSLLSSSPSSDSTTAIIHFHRNVYGHRNISLGSVLHDAVRWWPASARKDASARWLF